MKKFNGDAAGNLAGVVTVNIRWEKNDKGQFIPVEQPGSEKEHPAQLVLLAMGFLGPEQALLKDLKVDTDARSNVKAEYGKYGTSVPGVFAAGDARRGQSLVVWAINEGRGAARECDRWLMGATELREVQGTAVESPRSCANNRSAKRPASVSLKRNISSRIAAGTASSVGWAARHSAGNRTGAASAANVRSAAVKRSSTRNRRPSAQERGHFLKDTAHALE